MQGINVQIGDNAQLSHNIVGASNVQYNASFQGPMPGFANAMAGRIDSTPQTVEQPQPKQNTEITRGTKDQGKPKVMLSYQWDSYDTVEKIYNRLVSRGLSVWIDRKNMGDDLYKGMQNGVDQSDVVIVCLSKAYEESENCIQEATFAKQKRKKIIPVFVEKNYKPSGVVDFIIAGKIYIDFTSGRFEDSLTNLLARISNQAPQPDVNQKKSSQSCVII